MVKEKGVPSLQWRQESWLSDDICWWKKENVYPLCLPLPPKKEKELDYALVFRIIFQCSFCRIFSAGVFSYLSKALHFRYVPTSFHVPILIMPLIRPMYGFFIFGIKAPTPRGNRWNRIKSCWVSAQFFKISLPIWLVNSIKDWRKILGFLTWENLLT